MNNNDLPEIFNNSENPKPEKRFEKSHSDFIVAGVCAGLANYFKVEPAAIRLIMILTLIFGVWPVAAYFVAAFLMPSESDPPELSDSEKNIQKKINFRTVAGGILILLGIHFGLADLGFVSSNRIFLSADGFLFPFIVIAAGAFFMGMKSNDEALPAEIKNKKFKRSKTDRLFMGVCGGFAEYIHTETYTIRIIFVLASFLTLGLFVIVYMLFSIIVKTEEVIEPY